MEEHIKRLARALEDNPATIGDLAEVLRDEYQSNPMVYRCLKYAQQSGMPLVQTLILMVICLVAENDRFLRLYLKHQDDRFFRG